jgi:hypothetical protein
MILLSIIHMILSIAFTSIKNNTIINLLGSYSYGLSLIFLGSSLFLYLLFVFMNSNLNTYSVFSYIKKLVYILSLEPPKPHPFVTQTLIAGFHGGKPESYTDSDKKLLLDFIDANVKNGSTSAVEKYVCIIKNLYNIPVCRELKYDFLWDLCRTNNIDATGNNYHVNKLSNFNRYYYNDIMSKRSDYQELSEQEVTYLFLDIKKIFEYSPATTYYNMELFLNDYRCHPYKESIKGNILGALREHQLIELNNTNKNLSNLLTEPPIESLVPGHVIQREIIALKERKKREFEHVAAENNTNTPTGGSPGEGQSSTFIDAYCNLFKFSDSYFNCHLDISFMLCILSTFLSCALKSGLLLFWVCILIYKIRCVYNKYLTINNHTKLNTAYIWCL